MQYRKARLDEVQEVAQVCADAFEDYPYLSMIASNLKKPEQYQEFVLALQEILVRLEMCIRDRSGGEYSRWYLTRHLVHYTFLDIP